jgi:hypothetical protein
MVLHIVKFVNGFPRQGGVKHYSPGEIMTDHRLNANDLQLSFGVYCQLKILNPGIASPQGREQQFLWATQATCRVARCSLR